MDFEIPEEIRTLRESLKKFITREILPLEEKHHMDDTVPFEEHIKLRRRSGEVGFYGIHMPEEVGGGGLGTLGMCILNEELANHPLDNFYSDIFGGAGGPTPILLNCNEEQREKYLLPLMCVKKTCCFALTEPNAGSDAAAIQTTAVKDGDNYILNGSKHFCSNAPYADFAMVFAVTDKEKRARGGVTCFLVDSDTPGYSVKVQHSMLRDELQGEIALEDCRVPAANVLGEVGMGFVQAMEWIGHGRLAIGSNCVGMTQRLLNMSIEYAKQRVQFKKPIAKRQAIQWMLADMATELYAARMMVRNAAWKADMGQDILTETSMIKVFGAEMVNRAADMALQIHAGMGYMRELPIERIFRRVRVWRIVEGTSEIQRWIIARSLLKD